MDLDIEDIGDKKKSVKEDTIEKPSQNNAVIIQEVIESKDFDNALELFGDDLFNESMNEKKNEDINILQFNPKTVVDFRLYEKAIIKFYSNIPNELKADFAERLIISLVNKLNSYEIGEVLEVLSHSKSLSK